ncbi:MAG TPA: mechanosensitive ion channel family protein [Candidatus Paceibacterota bacterium]|nr:mechanosensitive ion channel family protein [Candidatus Paceibacterota bacterium]
MILGFVFSLLGAIVLAQESVHPLKPPDRSSPRAALRTFLEAGDAMGAFLARDYIPSPTRAEFHTLQTMGDPIVQGLDLSGVPPAARTKIGRAAAMTLYVTLSRIPLPPFEEIPDASQLMPSAGTNVTRWVIPNTSIALERSPGGPRSGEFLFCADTVAKTGKFYERVKKLPYIRPVPLQNLNELVATGGGWMIPHAWIRAMPSWLQAPLAKQAVWKWLGVFLLLGVYVLLTRMVFRFSRRGSSQHPFLQALAQAILPGFILLATPAFAYLALVQLNLREGVGGIVELLATAITFLAGAWISWRLAHVVAEAIIASPRIAPESIDAHLIRICTRLLGIVAGATLLALGADRLGLPLYGIIAGLGVGGLAIALAAQPTIENLIGGLSLFADKPIRVGDLCKYGEEIGSVESIGIRSTRIRGMDRTLTTIPNAALSRMPVVNLTRRDRMLIKCVLGVRYETSPEQLRFLLAGIRELLLSHPRIHPETARARLIGFGASSLDIEIHAYVITRDWPEYLGIREDVFLRIMDVVKESGTGFAFPSQTLYFTRDDGLDSTRSQKAEARVREWREKGTLPFPDFSPEQARQLRHSLVFPPPGSLGSPVAGMSTATRAPSPPISP